MAPDMYSVTHKLRMWQMTNFQKRMVLMIPLMAIGLLLAWLSAPALSLATLAMVGGVFEVVSFCQRCLTQI